MHNIDVRDSQGWLIGIVWGPLDWKEQGKQWAATRYKQGSCSEFMPDFASKVKAQHWVKGNGDAA